MLNIDSFITEMVEFVSKCLVFLGVISTDVNYYQVISYVNVKVVITVTFTLFIGLFLSYSWTHFKVLSGKFYSVSDQAASKALVSSLITPSVLSRDANRLNFLPETHDVKVQDDAALNVPRIVNKTRHNVTPENDVEATVSLHMALQMKEAGKIEKATKIFQHALALNPLDPDILNNYGEFIEEQGHDVIKANQLYTRVIIVCPHHSKAMVNVKRTLPVVEELDSKQLLRIDSKRDHLYQIPDSDSALKRVKKEAYFQHIHHTVAIEGNTMTLAETRMILETRMAVAGKSILEHNEILGLEEALRYVNSSLVSKHGILTVEDVLQVHRRVLGHADPLEAGRFRRSQVFVGEHTPPPPSSVVDMMEDLLDWLNCQDACKMHPVKFAALAHYKLVHIHPFADGNGRTARLIMNLILMRAGYPPVIIRKQDRSVYYELLRVADEGDVRPLIRFVAKCTEQTLDVYLYATEYGIDGIRALDGQKYSDQNVQITEIT